MAIHNNATECDCNIIHEGTIKKVQKAMPGDTEIEYMSELFKTLGDPTRIKILFALSQEEMCVCDIAALLNMTQSAISHQLRVLRNVRLVKNHKVGKSAFYSLDDGHVKSIFEQGMEHVQHTI